MFTGIITTCGTVSAIANSTTGNGQTFTITHERDAFTLQAGASVALNGVCITATHTTPTSFCCFASAETLTQTNLAALAPKSRINLEAALCYGAPIDGHLLYGHIDATLPLLKKSSPNSPSQQFTFALEPAHTPYIIPKGPVALNGISLTVYTVTATQLSVMIIPFTYAQTNLDTLKVGQAVNAEFDTVPKYLEKIMQKRYP